MGEVAVLNFANSVNLGGGGNMGLWVGLERTKKHGKNFFLRGGAAC